MRAMLRAGSSGALRFDHDDATLKMTYQKDNQDETTQIDNIQSLSGGERSFSTLAMLVSLGATIECPFRVMDEFDVFMDQVRVPASPSSDAGGGRFFDFESLEDVGAVAACQRERGRGDAASRDRVASTRCRDAATPS